ncbi:MAG TPA: amidase [Bryobacteraceae bacterium]|jgi:Asp-tRNA(Asn)/Glu-tRNA(Gln) amidotransferase A subunit family amidase
MPKDLLERRTLLQLAGVLAAAGRSAFAEPQQAPSLPAQRVSADQLKAALTLIGIDFDDQQIAAALPGVNRALNGYEAIRKVDIPLDTEPAFAFHPGLPGRVAASGKARFHPTKPAKTAAWKSIEDLAFWRVVDLAPLIHAKKITSTELTRMYLERLKQYGPKLLCVITLTESLALEQAAQADADRRRGKYHGPLHGIPWGAKDLFSTKGILTTWGAEPFQNQVPEIDATVVERLRSAGAVLVAKLSMGALAQGGLWFNGMTKTPWKLTETSSGSSAGSASATAAGLVGFALGTETLGSIVSPSVRCGTTGLRPTYGRVSRYGAMGLSWTMDKIGPICRGVEDCALVLNAIHGPDGHDRTVTTDPLNWEPRKPLKGLRIGVLAKAFDNFKGDDKAVYDQALADLRRAGVEMTAVELNDEDANKIRYLLSAEAAAAFDDITRDGRVGQLRGQSPGDWPNSFRTSRFIPAVEYIRAQRARTLLVEKMEKFFADWDVIVTPPFGALTTTNLTGHPQVVMKCGFVNGMPRGISFLGRLYEEGLPLRVALAYEQVTNWHNMNPIEPLKS